MENNREFKITPFEKQKYVDNEIGIDDVSITYTQNADCTEDALNIQELKISTRNNGVARFINIKTDSWSISDIDDLINVLNDFKIRAFM